MPAGFVVSLISPILSFYHKNPGDRKKLLLRYRPVFLQTDDTIGIAEKAGAVREKLLFQQLFHPFVNLRRLNHNIFGYCL
jgi:hypothetical protein